MLTAPKFNVEPAHIGLLFVATGVVGRGFIVTVVVVVAVQLLEFVTVTV